MLTDVGLSGGVNPKPLRTALSGREFGRRTPRPVLKLACLALSGLVFCAATAHAQDTSQSGGVPIAPDHGSAGPASNNDLSAGDYLNVLQDPTCPSGSLQRRDDACYQILMRALGLNLALATMAPSHQGFNLTRVKFPLGSAKLDPQAMSKMSAIADALLSPQIANRRFEIAAYTDGTGSHKLNRALSLARAKAVEAFLVARGVAESRLTISSHGDRHLRYPKSPRDSRNRVVEIRPEDQ